MASVDGMITPWGQRISITHWNYRIKHEAAMLFGQISQNIFNTLNCPQLKWKGGKNMPYIDILNLHTWQRMSVESKNTAKGKAWFGVSD
jgi:hypothetical protein